MQTVVILSSYLVVFLWGVIFGIWATTRSLTNANSHRFSHTEHTAEDLEPYEIDPVRESPAVVPFKRK